MLPISAFKSQSSKPCLAGDAKHRQQALRFLHVALASALDLRSPDESELPGRPVDKLAASLFAGYPPQHCTILPPDPTVGPKTKTQLLSERHVSRLPHLPMTQILPLEGERGKHHLIRTGVCKTGQPCLFRLTSRVQRTDKD